MVLVQALALGSYPKAKPPFFLCISKIQIVCEMLVPSILRVVLKIQKRKSCMVMVDTGRAARLDRVRAGRNAVAHQRGSNGKERSAEMYSRQLFSNCTM